MSGSSKLLIFIGKVVLLLIATSVLWFFVAGSYDHVLVKVADGLAPGQVTLAEYDSQIYFYPETSQTKAVAGVSSLALHYGVILFVVLMLATPGLRLAQRSMFLVIGLALMFLFHVIGLSLAARSIDLALRHAGRTESAGSTLRWLITLSGLLPPLLWGVCSLKYWLSIKRATAP